MSDPLQSLWASQPATPFAMAPAELRAHAARFQRRIRLRNATEYVASAFVIGVFTWYAFAIPNAIIQAGAALIVAGTLYVCWRLATTARAAHADDALAAESWAAFHRAELVRQRDALASVWRWYLGPLAPGMLVFLAGVALMPEMEAPLAARAVVFALGFVGVGFVFAAIGWLNAHVARKLTRDIEALDEASR